MSTPIANRLHEARQASRVLVLRGGPSAERDVSLASGAAVAAACRRLGHTVMEADIAPSDLSALETCADVVFPVLHGSFGEDGQLQAILEERNVCYVGSNSVASRCAMDKDAAKRVWRAAGLPTADWTCLDVGCPMVIMPEELVPPYVLKPVCEGSSIGVKFCDSALALRAAMQDFAGRYERAIVERRVFGPELTIGILGDMSLPIIQIRPAEGFYNYAAKYERDDTAYLFEPDVDQATYGAVQELAQRAFRALGCRDYARVDLMVDQHEGPQLLEINTIPGFTDHSLLPKAAAEAGMSFDVLVAALLDMALRRRRNWNGGV
jgi:D-alanine-D-alanine ligase